MKRGMISANNVSCHDAARIMSGSFALFSAARFNAALRFYFYGYSDEANPICGYRAP